MAGMANMGLSLREDLEERAENCGEDGGGDDADGQEAHEADQLGDDSCEHQGLVLDLVPNPGRRWPAYPGLGFHSPSPGWSR